MTPLRLSLLLLLLLAIRLPAVAAVTVVSTSPADGAANVPPNLCVLRVRFSAAVGPGYSFTRYPAQGSFPEPAGMPTFEEGNLVCVLPIRLQPGVRYAVGINGETAQNFRAAADNTPVIPHVIRFTTGMRASAAPVPTPVPTPPAVGGKTTAWQADLAYLAAELPKRHVNLFSRITKAQWEAAVRALNERLPGMSEPEVLVGLLRLVASVGDQHTGIAMLNGRRLKMAPLALYWFKEGIHVIGAPQEQASLLGQQVLKVGDTDIAAACTRVATLYPYDNEESKRKTAVVYLACPALLQGLGLIPSADSISLTVRNAEGKVSTVSMPAVSATEAPNLAQIQVPQPLPRRHLGEPYWAEYSADGDLVYFKYNICADAPEPPFGQVRAQVERLLAEHAGSALVIDLRDNSGGNSAVLDPFIDAIKCNAALNDPARLYVITGRRTFSSAVLNAGRLRQETEATFVGEAPGSRLSHFGEVKTFSLPNSGLTVAYSTRYFERGETPDLFTPDLPAAPNFTDYAAGRDPAMDAIVARRMGKQ